MRTILTLLVLSILWAPLACKDKKSPAAPPPAPAADTATFTVTPTGTPPTATWTATATRTNTLPIGFTHTWTVTHTRTGTPSLTPTGTPTRTITPFPTPPCAATAGVLGESNAQTFVSNAYSASPVHLYMTRYSLDRPVSAHSISAYVTDMSAGASMRLALYSSDGAGNPLIFLGGTMNTGAVMGWNKMEIVSPVHLPPGDYWIAANLQASAGTTLYLCEWGIDTYHIVDYPNPTPQVFPNPASLATPYNAPYGPSLFFEYCPLATYTPSPTPTFRCTVLVSPTITPQVHSSGYEPDYCVATPVGYNPPLGLGYIPVITPSTAVDRQRAVTGVLTAGDIDYFGFIARSTGIYTFYLDCFDSGAADHDVDLFLWNPACPTGSWLATTNGATGSVKSMTWSLTANDSYYLTVREMTTSASGSYRMVIVSP